MRTLVVGAAAAAFLFIALDANDASAIPAANSGWTTPLAKAYGVSQWSDGYAASDGSKSGCSGKANCLSHNNRGGCYASGVWMPKGPKNTSTGYCYGWPSVNYKAIDIAGAAPDGTGIAGAAVYADRGGTVTVDSSCRGVDINHGSSDGSTSGFGHLATVTVVTGQTVAINAKIGTVGTTCATGTHLHWSNWDNGQKGSTSDAYANDLRPIWGVPPNAVCGSSCRIWPVCTPAQNGYAAERKVAAHSGCSGGYANYECRTNTSSYGSGWYFLSCSGIQ